MLRTTISWKTLDDESVVLYLDIANVGNRRISNYKYALYSEDRDTARTGLLEHYPRWTEPASALAARTLCLAAFDTPTLPSKPGSSTQFAAFEITVDLIPGGVGHPRRLEAVSLTLQAANGVLQHSADYLVPCARQVALDEGGNNPYFIAVQALCHAAFDADNVPPIPEPFNPPFHVHAGRTYVRLSEIPEPARSIFLRRLRYFPALTVPGESPDNVGYAVAWQVFVGG